MKDQYNHITNFPIYSVTKTVCPHCGKEYDIEWKNVNGEIKPFPLIEGKKEQVEQDIIKYALSQVRPLVTRLPE